MYKRGYIFKASNNNLAYIVEVQKHKMYKVAWYWDKEYIEGWYSENFIDKLCQDGRLTLIGQKEFNNILIKNWIPKLYFVPLYYIDE